MRRFLRAILYLGLMASANATLADPAAIAALREGDMRKLVVHDAPRPVAEVAFVAADGAERRLSDLAGQHVLVNFWATWCAPCRKEMPMLAELQRLYGAAGLQVVTVAVGRNPPAEIANFFEEIGVDNLPHDRDPRMALARAMGVLGLPVTVVLDPEGQEIARLTGEADWSSASARAIIEALIGATGPAAEG